MTDEKQNAIAMHLTATFSNDRLNSTINGGGDIRQQIFIYVMESVVKINRLRNMSFAFKEME